MRRLILALAAALAMAGVAGQADADSSAAAASTHLKPAEIASFAKGLEHDLAARGIRVALVFRSGRPRASMPSGLAYTHGALWVYRDITAADGQVLHGYAVYNLYQGDGVNLPRTRSSLVQDWPVNFIAGSVEDDVAVIVPTPEMQRRMMAVIDSPTYAALHIPSYSLIDNPFDPRHQNCNTFMLDVVGAAVWQTTDERQIEVDLKAYFKPSVVGVDPLTRLFAPLFDERLQTDDQDGPIITAGYESIAAFMTKYHLAEATYAYHRPA